MFESFIRNVKSDRCNIMCSVDAHEKYNPSEHDYGSSGGGLPLPLNSTTEALVSLIPTIDFIGCWLQGLEHNLLQRANMNSI